MSESKLDLLQGTLDLMVLQTLATMGTLHGYGIARRIEQVAASHPYFLARKLYPNVEFFSAPVLYGVGLRPAAMPATFALSRVAGWTAHILEQLADNRLIRPSAQYVGPDPRPYVNLDQRGQGSSRAGVS